MNSAVSSVIDGTMNAFENNTRLFIPEIVLLVLSAAAIALQWRDQRTPNRAGMARAKL